MKIEVNLEKVYVPSEDVVAREIEGEIIIVPVTSGIGDLEDELYTLNEIGKAIWERLDGKRRLQDVIEELGIEFEGNPTDIQNDVKGFIKELLNRRIIVEASEK